MRCMAWLMKNKCIAPIHGEVPAILDKNVVERNCYLFSIEATIVYSL